MAELVMCIFDEDGNLISSNDAHAKMLQRERGQLTGHNFREWTPPSQLIATERNFFRGLEGEPGLFLRQVVRSDGALVLGRSQLFNTELNGKRIVMGSLQILDDLVAPSPKTKDVAEFIARMAQELAQLASAFNLEYLSDDLTRCSADAGLILEKLGKLKKDP